MGFEADHDTVTMTVSALWSSHKYTGKRVQRFDGWYYIRQCLNT